MRRPDYWRDSDDWDFDFLFWVLMTLLFCLFLVRWYAAA